MAGRLLDISDRLYGSLLQAYPPAFRSRFSGEMLQVFRSLSRETYAASGLGGVLNLWLLAFWDWALAALTQWWRRLIGGRMGNMSAPTAVQDGIQPCSPKQALVAALPFLAFGLSSLLNKLDYFHTGPASLPLWQVLLITPYLIFNWLLLIGLGIGIYLGFPRWAFSYLGWALLFAWWWSDMGFYGYSVDWKIWLPLLGVILLALLIRRTWQPLRSLFAGLWREWTLLALALYIFYASVYLIFDENHHPYLLLLVALTGLATGVGAWGYFRTAFPMRRVLWLIVGIAAAALISVYSYTTWDYREYYGLPQGGDQANLVGLIFPAALALIFLSIGLLAYLRYRRKAR